MSLSFSIPSYYNNPGHLDALPYYWGIDSKIPQYHDNQELLDYWNAKNIRYDLNKHLFRTKYDFDDMKDNEFHIAIGCSNTFGSGLDEASMWVTQLEEKIKEPIVNLSVTGSDIDILIRNLAKWMTSYSRPKSIIIQIPEPARFSYMISDKEILPVVPSSIVNGTATTRRSLHHIENPGVLYSINREIIYSRIEFLQRIVASYKIPVTYFSLVDFPEFDNTNCWEFPTKVNLFKRDFINDNHDMYKEKYSHLQNLSRDAMHQGDIWNIMIADFVFGLIKTDLDK